MNRYPTETLDPDEDNGTIVKNVTELAASVIGHRIVSIEEGARLRETSSTEIGTYRPRDTGLALTLDDGRRVFLIDTSDRSAYTDLEGVIRHLDRIDHMITGVGTTDGYTRWHIYADMGDVLELLVGWSPGNPFYYGYGFEICVEGATGGDTP